VGDVESSLICRPMEAMANEGASFDPSPTNRTVKLRERGL
jgi:hypothetical protein